MQGPRGIFGPAAEFDAFPRTGLTHGALVPWIGKQRGPDHDKTYMIAVSKLTGRFNEIEMAFFRRDPSQDADAQGGSAHGARRKTAIRNAVVNDPDRVGAIAGFQRTRNKNSEQLSLLAARGPNDHRTIALA